MAREKKFTLEEEMKTRGYNYVKEEDAFKNHESRVAHIIYGNETDKLAFGYLLVKHEFVLFDNPVHDGKRKGAATETSGRLIIYKRNKGDQDDIEDILKSEAINS